MTKVLLALHLLAAIGLVVLLNASPAPLHTTLLRWDALWYDVIRSSGYTYHEVDMNPTAFFPLFPYLWRITALSPVGICLLNLVLFTGALTLLYRQLKLRPEVLLLYTVVPSALYFYQPYTESLFFLASSLVLVGLDRPSRSTLLGGLLVGAFTRVTSFFYLPSLLVVEALQLPGDRKSLSARFWRMVLYVGVTGCGLAAVMLVQWWQTGVWFAFNKTQAHFLNHHLRFPNFPLTSNHSPLIVWLDGLALLVGTCAAVWVIRTIVRVYRDGAPSPRATVLFSAVFISCSAFYTFAHAPLVKSLHSTDILSMHRYVFCTPFFLVLVNEFLPRHRLSASRTLLGLLPVLLLTAALGLLNLSPVPFNFTRNPIILPGLAYAALILVFAALWLQSANRWARSLLYIGSISLQFLYAYLHTVGVWIA